MSVRFFLLMLLGCTALSASAQDLRIRDATVVTVTNGTHEKADILVRGRNVLLVDDVYTTGATVSAIAKTLGRAGAAGVDVLTFARVLPGDFRPDEAEPI